MKVEAQNNLTYLEKKVIEKLQKECRPVKAFEIGPPEIVRGCIGSLVKKGIVIVSKNGHIQLKGILQDDNIDDNIDSVADDTDAPYDPEND